MKQGISLGWVSGSRVLKSSEEREEGEGSAVYIEVRRSAREGGGWPCAAHMGKRKAEPSWF